MNAHNRHLSGAFAAMLFVGASWGANLPVTKVMLQHFDLIPMAAVRTAASVVILGTILLVGALLFMPAAVLGPVAEHFGPMPFGN